MKKQNNNHALHYVDNELHKVTDRQKTIDCTHNDYGLIMIFNPTSSSDHSAVQPYTNVQPFKIPNQMINNRYFIQTINKLQSRELSFDYPDNFHLYIPKNSMKVKKLLGVKTTIKTLPEIQRLVGEQIIKYIAWQWFFIIHWFFETDSLMTLCQSYFQEDTGFTVINHKGSIKNISIGYIFDNQINSTIIHKNDAVLFLINPVSFIKRNTYRGMIKMAVKVLLRYLQSNYNESLLPSQKQLLNEFKEIVSEETIRNDTTEILESCHSYLS